MDSSHKGPVMWKASPLYDTIISLYEGILQGIAESETLSYSVSS